MVAQYSKWYACCKLMKRSDVNGHRGHKWGHGVDVTKVMSRKFDFGKDMWCVDTTFALTFPRLFQLSTRRDGVVAEFYNGSVQNIHWGFGVSTLEDSHMKGNYQL
ncbi:hypothetical protein FRX31_024794 [Thalictrum thalictroides]|uniref:Uncharacterized protein n=1 Tax=Thalictrum thalictroides TaxID=46969 RepID=A0A7J6VMQ3_THATH|nr:hypothetical protein FRX31_024794 [Thalictrum thalictroides]